MNKIIKYTAIFVGIGAILTVGAAALGFRYISQAKANEPTSSSINLEFGNLGGDFRIPGNPADWQEALAKGLGISVEALQSAQQKASDAAIQQAVKEGLISQNQADIMILSGRIFRFGIGGNRSALPNEIVGIDYDSLLAKELNISVEKLQEARVQAQSDLLAQAVAAGRLTQDQADLIIAGQALISYLDPQTLYAEALGITPEELQNYREQGLSISQILTKVGKTAIEARDALAVAYKAAVQKAVTDGVITQTQADLFLEQGFKFMGGYGGFFDQQFHGGPGRLNRGFRFGPYPNPQTTPSVPSGGGL